MKSIKDIGGWFKSPWEIRFCKIGGKTLTLDEIEDEIIRPRFKDPRVHFAVNCASKSYLPQESKVIYQSKACPRAQRRDRKQEKTFDALEWLAAMCCHVPNKGEQMVRYYGHYSNVSRGQRQKENRDALIPSILEPDSSSKPYRKNWARLIQKIYQADPLVCSRCQGRMKVISFIEDLEVIREILEHLGLWLAKTRPQPKANTPPVNIHLDYSDSQIPPLEDSLYKDPDYPIETHAS